MSYWQFENAEQNSHLRGMSSLPSSSTSPWINFQHFVSNFFNFKALYRCTFTSTSGKVSNLIFIFQSRWTVAPFLCCFCQWNNIFCLDLKSSCVNILYQMTDTLHGYSCGFKKIHHFNKNWSLMDSNNQKFKIDLASLSALSSDSKPHLNQAV